MIRLPRTGQYALKNSARFPAFLGMLRGGLAGLFVASVLFTGVGPWVTRAQTTAPDNLPPILHSILYGCTNQTPATDLPQRVAVPSYFYPGDRWTKLMGGVPTVGLAIINPGNGPGPSPDNDDVQNYVKQVATLRDQAPGLIILGYVYTDRGGRDPLDVMRDIDNHYNWYGVDGIFFDEASTNVSMAPYYQEIHDYVKGKTDKCVVVINPGTRTDPAYMTTADIIVNFEGYYSSYASDQSWEDPDPDWERNFPAYRFWHMVHTTPEVDMPNAIALSKQRHAGWVYVTPDLFKDDPNTTENEIALLCDDPNTPENEVDDPATPDEEVGELCDPWDTLPPYWSDLLQLVAQP